MKLRKNQDKQDKKDLSERDIWNKHIGPGVKRVGWDGMLQMRERGRLHQGAGSFVRGKLVSRGKAKRVGERIRKLRLSRNMAQLTTADKAGISEKALRNLETGRGSTVETLLRTLKALDSLQGIEMLAPDVTVNPLALLHSAKAPQRVRTSRTQRKK